MRILFVLCLTFPLCLSSASLSVQTNVTRQVFRGRAGVPPAVAGVSPGTPPQRQGPGLGRDARAGRRDARPTHRTSAALLLFPYLVAKERPQPLSTTELLRVKRIIIQLVGTLARESEPLFDQLSPFMVSRSEFERSVMVCSAACWGDVRLRGGLTLRWVWPNIPPGFPGADEEPRIDYAELLRGPKKRVIFSRVRVVTSLDGA